MIENQIQSILCLYLGLKSHLIEYGKIYLSDELFDLRNSTRTLKFGTKQNFLPAN